VSIWAKTQVDEVLRWRRGRDLPRVDGILAGRASRSGRFHWHSMDLLWNDRRVIKQSFSKMSRFLSGVFAGATRSSTWALHVRAPTELSCPAHVACPGSATAADGHHELTAAATACGGFRSNKLRSRSAVSSSSENTSIFFSLFVAGLYAASPPLKFTQLAATAEVSGATTGFCQPPAA